MKKQINKVVEQIESIDSRCQVLWDSRGEHGPQKQAKRNLRIMSEQIRPLDLLRESLFKKLWALHDETDFEFSEMEEISREKRFNGKTQVTRITYCDGQFHYVVNKNGKFQYGYVCTC